MTAREVNLSSVCFWTILWMTFSNNIPVAERSILGRKFCGNFGSLPGFGNVMALLPSMILENGTAEGSY
jgi:hypothetical protein